MKIEIRNLKKVFGTKTAVDIEKADIHDGEILGLVGNNGAGKTTLFRLILDLLIMWTNLFAFMRNTSSIKPPIKSDLLTEDELPMLWA